MDTHLEAGGAWLPDTIELIEEQMDLSPELFKGVPAQKWLEVALENVWLNGCHDDAAGSVETTNHVFRVGRHVMETDNYGFKAVHSFGTEEAAQELIDFVAEQEARIENEV